MVLAAEGSISLVEEHCRNLLANLAAFRTWAEAADVAAAEALIHTDEVPSSQSMPWCLIYLDSEGEGYAAEIAAGGHEFVFDEDGRIHILLQRVVPGAYANSVQDAERDLKNHVGKMIDEIKELTGTGDSCEPLTVTRIRMFGPWRFDEDMEETALGKIQAVGLLLDWGM